MPEKDGYVFGIAYKIPDEAEASTIEYLNFREKAGYEVKIGSLLFQHTFRKISAYTGDVLPA